VSRPALPEERGADLRPEVGDPAPEGLRHRPELVDSHDGPPFERCRHCERVGPPGAIDPFAECPARELPSRVEQRADRADADDEQEVLA